MTDTRLAEHAAWAALRRAVRRDLVLDGIRGGQFVPPASDATRAAAAAWFRAYRERSLHETGR